MSHCIHSPYANMEILDLILTQILGPRVPWVQGEVFPQG
jgi:hypothetical protein